VLIVNGGLGPTSDDLSALAAATAKGEGLILHEAWLETMTRFFAERGRRWPQATVSRRKSRQRRDDQQPGGDGLRFCRSAQPLPDVFHPGVPSEFKVMVEQEILPRLRERFRCRTRRCACV
jgi:molybdopterin-biosynthesis enzyme MoeA-like protein